MFARFIVLVQVFSGQIPWSTLPDAEVIVRKSKGETVPIPDSVFRPLVPLIQRCLDIPEKRPSFVEILGALRSVSGLPWVLPPSVQESLRWQKIDVLPTTEKVFEVKEGETGVRVAELGFAMPLHKPIVDAIRGRCGKLNITRIFLLDNPALFSAFEKKITLHKAQLETTYFRSHDFKEKERK